MKKCLDKLCSDHNIYEPNWCDSRVDVVTCYKKPPLMDDSELVANFRCSDELSCSFCARKQADVKQLIAGEKFNGVTAYICNGCIALSVEMLIAPKLTKIETAR